MNSTTCSVQLVQVTLVGSFTMKVCGVVNSCVWSS